MLRTTERAWWPAVGAPLERRVRAHWWRAAVAPGIHAPGIHAPDSGGPEACRQEQSRYSASAGTATALHGAMRLASSSSRCGRSEEAFPLFGVAATVTAVQQSTPSAASSCVWTGRLQAGPDQIPTFRGQRQSAARAGAAHHRACAALTNTMSSAVLRRGRCFRGVGGHGALVRPNV